MALAFQRPDVDAFKDEIDFEQYQEWLAYFQIEPQGWGATQIATTRLSYIIAQTHSPKQLREADYALSLSSNGGGNSPQMNKILAEAQSIRVRASIKHQELCRVKNNK